MPFSGKNGQGKISLRCVERVVVATCVSLLTIGLASPSFGAEMPGWKTDVTAGLAEAKRDQKYVLADVYTDWCGWCKRLDRDTFSNDSMVKYLSGKFVCIKVNAEDNGPGQKLAHEYGVAGYPCALIFDRSGKFIGKIAGYRDPKVYQDAITQIISHPPVNPMDEQ